MSNAAIASVDDLDEDEFEAVQRSNPLKSNSRILTGDSDDSAAPPPFKRRLLLTPVSQADAPAPPDEVDSDGPSLSDAALYGPLGIWIKTIDPYTEAHPAAILLQMLTVLGSLIGRKPFVYAAQYRQRANLFSLVIGQSAIGRKGTSWNIVNEIALGADPDLDKRKLVGLASGEAMIRRLNESGDAGSLVYESEFSKLLTVKSYSGSTLSQRIRSGFDGEFMGHDTKEVTLGASDYHLCIVAHIVPDEMANGLSSNEHANGFTNRFLFCHSHKSKRLQPTEARVPESVLSQIIDELRGIVAWARTQGEIRFSDSAAHEFNQMSAPEDGSTYSGLISRQTSHIARIALILALCDKKSEIHAKHVSAAKAIWQYSADTIRYYLDTEAIASTPDAAAFLADLLSDGQAVLATTIFAEGKLIGLTPAQIRRGAKKIGITKASGTILKRDGHSYWKLPRKKVALRVA